MPSVGVPRPRQRRRRRSPTRRRSSFRSSSTTTPASSTTRRCRTGRWRDALFWLGNSRVLPSLTIIAQLRGSAAIEPSATTSSTSPCTCSPPLGVFVLAQLLCRTPRAARLRGRRRGRSSSPPSRRCSSPAIRCRRRRSPTSSSAYASMAALFYVWAVVCYLRARLRADGTGAAARDRLDDRRRRARRRGAAVEGERGQPAARAAADRARARRRTAEPARPRRRRGGVRRPRCSCRSSGRSPPGRGRAARRQTSWLTSAWSGDSRAGRRPVGHDAATATSSRSPRCCRAICG